MSKEDQDKKLRQILTKAWKDQTFKERLLADAASVLGEEGLEVPEGLTIKVVENTDTLVHSVIPLKQAEALDEAALAAIAGGYTLPGDRPKQSKDPLYKLD